ncbi:ABC transporter ATP-binding protein [Bacillaceae bacterium SIJ1]|uniref:ABC transporter ATP-binding protein n=1 Tax=Litoribacterium kuwaitense TaxID=1398745 RepID=UPI0013EE2FEC|nr:ABC transporter ATP-binding protein [Litoribacterium kuwaitense]NGP43845.1 ABC transporter ATP-binding protein [Litoribacterium kuwaitense]
MNHTTPQLKEVWSLLWDRLGPNRFIFILGFLSSLSQSIAMMLEPLFVNLIFNRLETASYQVLYVLLAVSMGIFILLIGLTFVGEYLKQLSMARLQRTMIVESADHAQRLPFERAKSVHSSDLVQRVTSDTSRMTDILNMLINDIGYQMAMFMLAVVYLFWLNWKIAIGLVLLAPLTFIFSHVMRKQLQRIGYEVAEQEAIVRQRQQDALQGMEIIRVYKLADWMRDRFLVERERLNTLYTKKMWWYQGLNILSSTFTHFLIICTVLIVGWMAIEGTMAVGGIVAFFTLVWRVNSPVQAIGQIWGQIQEGLGASARVATLKKAEKEPDPETSSVVLPDHDLRFNAVSFMYRAQGLARSQEIDNHVQVQQMTFRLSPGDFLGLVGPSGSGKSTVAKLAAGLFIPTDGEVLIGEQRIIEDLESFRQFIAYVPQDPYFMYGTIRENLMIASSDLQHGEAAIIEAAQKAHAHEFIIALPNGYDTVIGENGQSLSGGQRQRLALARAFLAERPIWILDEATSALDTDTEQKVMKEIWQFVKEKGHRLLMVAHRLSTLQHADRIIVLNEGKITQEVSDIGLLSEQHTENEQVVHQR